MRFMYYFKSFEKFKMLSNHKSRDAIASKNYQQEFSIFIDMNPRKFTCVAIPRKAN